MIGVYVLVILCLIGTATDCTTTELINWLVGAYCLLIGDNK